jgi:hypothetical protein
MATSLKPIKIYWRGKWPAKQSSYLPAYLTSTKFIYLDHVPNPPKVLIIFEELDLPYESAYVELDEFKKPPLTDANPNGRIPGISLIVEPSTPRLYS